MNHNISAAMGAAKKAIVAEISDLQKRTNDIEKQIAELQRLEQALGGMTNGAAAPSSKLRAVPTARPKPEKKKGTPRGGLAPRIVELLSDGRAREKDDIMRATGVTIESSVRSALSALVRSGSIRQSGEPGRWRYMSTGAPRAVARKRGPARGQKQTPRGVLRTEILNVLRTEHQPLTASQIFSKVRRVAPATTMASVGNTLGGLLRTKVLVTSDAPRGVPRVYSEAAS